MKILPHSQPAVEDVARAAQRQLRSSPYFFLRELSCAFSDGVLTLRGHVPMGQLRDIAEQIVSRVEGVDRVLNRVEIVDPLAPPSAAPGLRNAG